MPVTTYPLHPAQYEIFIDQAMNPGSPHYNIGMYVKLEGALNEDLFNKVLNKALETFDALRIRFDTLDDNPVCFLVPNTDTNALNQLDFSNHTNPEAEAIAWIKSQYRLYFDLNKETKLYQFALLKISSNVYWFFIRMHHIIIDGYGVMIFVRNIADNYQNGLKNEHSTKLYPSYINQLAAASNYRKSPAYLREGEYWKPLLHNQQEPLLKKNKSYPEVQHPESGNYYYKLSPDQSQMVNEVLELTKSNLLQLTTAALSIYFNKLNGREDLTVGTASHRRDTEEQQNTLGLYAGITPFVISFSKDTTTSELLKIIAKHRRESRLYRNFLVTDLVQALDQSAPQSPVFQVMVNYAIYNFKSNFGEEIQSTIQSIGNEKAKVPLEVFWREYGGGQPLQLGLHFRHEYFSEDEIRLLGQRIIYILSQFKNNYNKSIAVFDIIPPAERLLLNQFNDTTLPFQSDLCVIDLIEKQVKLTPQSIALVCNATQITYQQLDARANQLAHFLRKNGVKAETMVPVCLDRSIDLFVSILAILKAGGAYVPLDPAYPVERLNYMIEDAGATFIISSKKFLQKIVFSSHVKVIDIELDHNNIILESVLPLTRYHSVDNLAYVMYTSGSTGKPKGVMIAHANIAAFIAWCHNEFSMDKFDMVYATTSICFDLSVFEIFYPLTIGKVIRILDNGLSIKDHVYIDQRVLINTVPTVVENLIKEQVDLKNVTLINMCGEPVPQFVKDGLDTETIEVRNLYGPTEDTIYSTLYRLTKDKPILIGKGINNTTVYILDKNKELLPLGCPGEICIGGAGLSRGYHNRPELTEEKFTGNPLGLHGHTRMYTTGDWGRWLYDGNLEFLGRKDNQVKINGHRVELGEIESELLKSNLVQQAVVKVCLTINESKYLLAYVVPKNGSFKKEEATMFLKSKLPHYMLPSHWVELETMPLTNNGKINRNALPEMDFELVAAQDYQSPQTKTEIMLCALWKDVFKSKEIGITHNFLDLGGNSIMAITITSRLKRLGYAIEPKDLFLYQSIKLLASFLEQSYKCNGESVVNASVVKTGRTNFKASTASSIFEIKKGSGTTPLYIVCGKGGTLFAFTKFVELLDPQQQVYVIQHPTILSELKTFPTSITGMAERYVSEILLQNPTGPYALSGHCLGGKIALEMAKILEAAGKEVTLLAVFDTFLGRGPKRDPLIFLDAEKKYSAIQKALYKFYLKTSFQIFLYTKHPAQALQYRLQTFKKFIDRIFFYESVKNSLKEEHDIAKIQCAIDKATVEYAPTPYNRSINIFFAREQYYFFDRQKNIRFKKYEVNSKLKKKWQDAWKINCKKVSFYDIQGDHSTIFEPTSGGKDLADTLQKLLNNSVSSTELIKSRHG